MVVRLCVPADLRHRDRGRAATRRHPLPWRRAALHRQYRRPLLSLPRDVECRSRRHLPFGNCAPQPAARAPLPGAAGPACCCERLLTEAAGYAPKLSRWRLTADVLPAVPQNRQDQKRLWVQLSKRQTRVTAFLRLVWQSSSSADYHPCLGPSGNSVSLFVLCV